MVNPTALLHNSTQRTASTHHSSGHSAGDRAEHDSASMAVRAECVTKRFGDGESAVTALDQVSVAFPSGRLTAIMGPSGSGKSTLLHCLAGLDSLSSGQVYIADTALGGLSDRDLTELRRARIGFVFQAFNLLPTLTARENIELPLSLAGERADPSWLDTVVSMVGLQQRLEHRPSELSGGQQQRVAVARALISRPSVIFADEPTGNLDSVSGTTILEFLRDACDRLGQTIVMVTHDPVAASFAHEVVFLADGRIVDRLAEPTRQSVLDTMKSLGG